MTRNQEIANTILTQLGGANRLSMMTGAYNFVAIQNGLSFKIKNPKANYIKITLNGKDLYDLEVGRIRGNTYKVVHQSNDLYFDMLKPAIEKATGMYLSLFAKGGEIGHSVAVKKDFKKISQRDIDLFVDYCYGFYGKGGTYADDLNGGFTKAKVKSAVMKYIKNLGDVDTWGGGDSMDRESVREILQPSYSKFTKGGKIKTKYTIFVYYGGEMEDEVFHTNNLALAKKYAMKGEHAEIMDNESNTLVENFGDGGTMAKGGKTKKGKKEPMIVRSYFEDEPYEYAKGGSVSNQFKVTSGRGGGKETWIVSHPKIEEKGVYFKSDYSESEAKKTFYENVFKKYEKGFYKLLLAKGGNTDVLLIAYGDSDYDNKIGHFTSKKMAKYFAKQNVDKYDTIMFEDFYGDTILVNKGDTNEDIDWLFSDSMAKGGSIGGFNYSIGGL